MPAYSLAFSAFLPASFVGAIEALLSAIVAGAVEALGRLSSFTGWGSGGVVEQERMKICIRIRQTKISADMKILRIASPR
ncbi:MAG: hypothetical protein NTY36_00565 [Deltaproteobacteria bacterium]|nr:hypothetical protein [Deltaproteobacteria bacterium]